MLNQHQIFEPYTKSYLVTVRDDPDYQSNIENLTKIMAMRSEVRSDIDQRYLTVEGIVNRIDALKESRVIENKRVLMIGDADLTGIAISLFGNPKEVVVADIDERLSEIYFEAMLDFDAAIRYLYHDMRIKIIAILRDQYSLLVLEPPRTIGGVDVFLSRAFEILEVAEGNHMFVSIPGSGEIRDHFNKIIGEMNLSVVKVYEKINKYSDGTEPSDFVELKANDTSRPIVTDHFVRPFYEQEVAQDTYQYRCICKATFDIGIGQHYETIEELESSGCPKCDYNGIFAFNSKIQLM